MRSTDFPFAVTPQRLQRGGKLSVDYSAPSADVADLLDPTGIVGRGRLEARETSWRDKLKDELAVRLGRRNAEQMMQVLDFTPAGAAFVGNEAALAVRGGKRGEAAANVALAALPLPGAGKAAKKVAKSPLAVKPQGITAYHGSPHTFDRFDMSKIGTGEGAQSYGRGLYFAENEETARSYRDALSPTKVAVAGVPLPDNVQRRLADAANRFSTVDSYLDPLITSLERRKKELAQAVKAGDTFTASVLEADANDFQGVVDALLPYRGKAFDRVPAGSMYQVRIDADPADFLDYDAPLSGQPQRVREGVARAMSRGDETLGDLFGDLSDPNAMQLAGLFPKSSGAQVYNTITASDRAAATQALREAGIPGIKYLDQGSRGAGDGTRNYVVFDDKLVSILKRYGWAPGMAIPAAAMAEYEAEQEFARGGLAAKYGV